MHYEVTRHSTETGRAQQATNTHRHPFRRTPARTTLSTAQNTEEPIPKCGTPQKIMTLSCANRVGRVGLEPTTYGLKVRYSAIELAPLGAKRSQLDGPLGNELRTARQRRKGDVRRRVWVTPATGQGTATRVSALAASKHGAWFGRRPLR